MLGLDPEALASLLELPGRGVEVLPPNQRLLTEPLEARGEASAVLLELRLDVPVDGGVEGASLAFAHDAEPHRDALHPAGGQAGAHLLPQHRGQLIAEQPIDDAPALLRPHQIEVDVARLLDRLVNRLVGDLVEDDPTNRNLRVEHLDDVPADALALAIFIRREQQLVGALERRLQGLDVPDSCPWGRCTAARSLSPG